jgi:hypothetical protein
MKHFNEIKIQKPPLSPNSNKKQPETTVKTGRSIFFVGTSFCNLISSCNKFWNSKTCVVLQQLRQKNGRKDHLLSFGK